MIRITTFSPEHVTALTPSATARIELEHPQYQQLIHGYARMGRAHSVLDAAGTVIFCGGAAQIHGGHAMLWALLGGGLARAQVRAVLRATRYFIADLPHRRVDAMIEAGNSAAIAWARACGLGHDTTLAEAAHGGGDLLVFRRLPV